MKALLVSGYLGMADREFSGLSSGKLVAASIRDSKWRIFSTSGDGACGQTLCIERDDRDLFLRGAGFEGIIDEKVYYFTCASPSLTAGGVDPKTARRLELMLDDLYYLGDGGPGVAVNAFQLSAPTSLEQEVTFVRVERRWRNLTAEVGVRLVTMLDWHGGSWVYGVRRIGAMFHELVACSLETMGLDPYALFRESAWIRIFASRHPMVAVGSPRRLSHGKREVAVFTLSYEGGRSQEVHVGPTLCVSSHPVMDADARFVRPWLGTRPSDDLDLFEQVTKGGITVLFREPTLMTPE